MGKKSIRIAFARIQQESNGFSSVETELSDFEQTHYLQGDALLAAIKPSGKEAEGFLNNAELSGFYKGTQDYADDVSIELVPIFSAWAISGGPLSAEAYQDFETRLVDSLKEAGPVDGFFFTMHGALRAVNNEHPETSWLKKAKAVLGPDVPIAVTLDLHAHLRDEMVELADILCAYQTNPHRDHVKVGAKAAHLLLDLVLGKIQVTKTWRYLPMVMGGGSTIDLLPTMFPIFRKIKKLESNPEVLSISLFMVHPFLKSPDLGWAVHIMTRGNQSLAESLADEVAELAWSVKDIMPPVFDSPQEALAKVASNPVARKLGTICLCDTSDAVGAGGTGENSHLLQFLLEEATAFLSYVPIRAPQVFETLEQTAIGARVKVEVGGYVQPEVNPGVMVSGQLKFMDTIKGYGRCAVIDTGHVQVVVTEGPPLAFKPDFYEQMGLSVWKADMVVTKGFFPPRIFFALHARKTLNVTTKGITDLSLYKTLKLDGDVHPIKPVDDWRPADAKRRGLV